MSRLRKILQFFKLQSFPSNQPVFPELEEVCIFPLPNVVLIPGALLPLHIFEERYRMMVDDILSKNLPLAMSFGKRLENGVIAPSTICGSGKVSLLYDFPDGRKDICVEGKKRVKIFKITQEKPYIKAQVTPMPDIPVQSKEMEKSFTDELSLLVKRLIFLSPKLNDQLMNYLNIFQKPHQLADFIGFNFFPPAEKQVFLETIQREKRIQMIINFTKAKIADLEKQMITPNDLQVAQKTLH